MKWNINGGIRFPETLLLGPFTGKDKKHLGSTSSAVLEVNVK